MHSKIEDDRNHKTKQAIDVDGHTIFKMIAENYSRLEQSIAHELYFQAEHGTTIGTFREAVWKELFEQIVPKKFVVEQSAFILDSEGNVSKEVDIVILDEIYTPYIFRQGHLKFIPIEAVAVAVECKSENLDENAILKWKTSIETLKTSNRGIARTIGKVVSNESDDRVEQELEQDKKRAMTQTGTRPILILCHLSKQSRNYENMSTKLKKEFDITIWAQEKSEKRSIQVTLNDEFQKISDVYKKLNHHPYYQIGYQDSLIQEANLGELSLEDYRIKKGPKEVSLLTLNFMLNQALMLINNPMFFPHLAYVDRFNQELNVESKNEI